MNDRCLHARLEIESAFRERADRDVELVAEQVCRRRGLEEAALRCRTSDAVVSDMIWARFGTFDWNDVAYVYDGTYSQHSRYVWAKVDLTVEWAVAHGRMTPEVEAALHVTLRRLREFWREWAGYEATQTDDLALALDQ